jgi:uncharacterized phage protein (TIGR01671 family)
MREIKFRAWDGIKKRMVDISKEPSVENGLTYEGYFHLLRGAGFAFHVMQYTGLRDKNSKEIYQGDIVEVCALHPIEPTFTTEVKLNTGSFTASKGRLYRTLAHWAQDGIEVIGNIYENPELLKHREKTDEK